ncbi:MAG: hypothetical protein ACKV1O_21550 [Saprospiraceae bacterium]
MNQTNPSAIFRIALAFILMNGAVTLAFSQAKERHNNNFPIWAVAFPTGLRCFAGHVALATLPSRALSDRKIPTPKTRTYYCDVPKIEAPVSGFLILVETTENGLKLTCQEGCAWGELSFSLKAYQTQAVDQYGMTSLKRDQPEKNDSLSNFLFTVKKTKEGLKFEGKEGTAWNELSFKCPGNNCYQHIDQEGMATRD